MATQTEQFFNALAHNLGVDSNHFKLNTRNPNNADILATLQHKDIDGFESNVFASCFQEVRKQTGPYKVFGSKQNQHVTDCIHRHVVAFSKAANSTGLHL